MLGVNVCFHGIGTPRRELEPGEDVYWIDPDTLSRVLDLAVGRTDVRLSFDDANASDADIALPRLQERGLVAAFFVVTGRLGRPGSLSACDVRALHAAGMSIGNHGMTHRPWRGLHPAQQREELVAARRVLADLIGAPVQDAALPLGRYDRRLLGQLRALDYRSVHTSDRRWARTGDWLQPRYSIRRGDTALSVQQDVLRRPPVSSRARAAVVGAAKRWR